MPKTFTKPINYDLQLLIKDHPTLRTYQKLQEQSEVDPDYHLVMQKRERHQLMDEITPRNSQGV